LLTATPEKVAWELAPHLALAQNRDRIEPMRIPESAAESGTALDFTRTDDSGECRRQGRREQGDRQNWPPWTELALKTALGLAVPFGVMEAASTPPLIWKESIKSCSDE
jgi:hypothetical protein